MVKLLGWCLKDLFELELFKNQLIRDCKEWWFNSISLTYILLCSAALTWHIKSHSTLDTCANLSIFDIHEMKRIILTFLMHYLYPNRANYSMHITSLHTINGPDSWVSISVYVGQQKSDVISCTVKFSPSEASSSNVSILKTTITEFNRLNLHSVLLAQSIYFPPWLPQRGWYYLVIIQVYFSRTSYW